VKVICDMETDTLSIVLRNGRGILVVSLVAWLLPVAGCARSTPAPPKDVGTTATVGLPESDPPVLSRAVADRIRPGMSQEDVLAVLQDAARETPSAKSSVEAAVTQGKMNTIRYDLTVTQGKRKLVLAFRDNKLVEKAQEGLE
jgi:hypothetical protein